MDGFVPCPAPLAARYRTAGYWGDTTLPGLLATAAARWPDRPAILRDDQRPLSYTELDRAATSMASRLLTSGLRPGDRVIMQVPNRPEFPAAFFGALRAGLIPIMCLPAHRRAEIRHLASLAGATGYLYAPSPGFDYRALAHSIGCLAHIIDITAENDAEPAPLPDTAPGPVALMLVSGGTTGLPKLIPRTHADYVYNAVASAGLCALTPTDVYLAALPAAHNFPLACPGIIGTLATGGAVVFAGDPSPEHAFAAIAQHRVTITALVPPLAQLWSAATEWEEADISTLRLVQVGGARIGAAAAQQTEQKLNTLLQQVFGMAEGLLNFTRLDDPAGLRYGTQGRPLSPADQIRIVAANGETVTPGAEGELQVKGPYTIHGYFAAGEYNKSAFTGDGYYRSGDLVRQLPTGHLVVSGRIKDIINRGGENISSSELQEHLLSHPGIRHAAVFAMPDEALGEKVCAAIVAGDDVPALAEIIDFLASRGLATFKHPDQIFQLPALPVTAVGKIDTRALVSQLSRQR